MDILQLLLGALIGSLITIIAYNWYWMYQNQQFNRLHSCIPVTVTEDGETKRGWLIRAAIGYYDWTMTTTVLPSIVLVDDPLGPTPQAAWRSPYHTAWQPSDPNLTRDRALEVVRQPSYPIARWDRPHTL